MLTDKEIAERMLGYLLKESAEKNDKEYTTAGLLKAIPIDAEELLPVGDLNSVHHTLMETISEDGRLSVEFGKYGPCCTAMPYHLPWKIRTLNRRVKKS